MTPPPKPTTPHKHRPLAEPLAPVHLRDHIDPTTSLAFNIDTDEPYTNPWIAGTPARAHLSAVHATIRLLAKANNATQASTRPLNLSEDGNPIKFNSAIHGPDAAHWQQANCEEFDRLIGDTQTIHAIMPHDQPTDRRKDTAYYNPQCKEKIDSTTGNRTFRVRGAIGGDRIHYPGDVSSACADMAVVKTLLQSVVSDNAKWMTADIKDYYLMTPLPRSEYLRITLKQIPTSIISKYDLTRFIHRGAVLFEVTKGMYGLPQAGLLAQQRLITHLAAFGYNECPDVPCLFRHATRPISFSLVVDDFGIKYVNKADADHLIETIRRLYELKVDWLGRQYLGVTIEFDNKARTVTLSMPGYIEKILRRFCPDLVRGAASPALYIPPVYGSKSQTTTIDDSPPLPASGVERIQQIVGCFLYYARAIDPTMLPATTSIASDMSHATEMTAAAVDRLLAYAAAYPNNKLVFTACDMILHLQSDASHLSRSRSRGVAGGFAFFGNRDAPTHINGAIHAHSTIIDVVVSAVSEAEYAALFCIARIGEWLRTIATALGYPQPPTLIYCDNACAVGLANDTVKLKRSKAIDMRYHWVRDRVRQGHFIVEWRQGAHNLADFFTKPLAVKDHQALIPFLVRTTPDPTSRYLKKKATRAAAFSVRHKRTL